MCGFAAKRQDHGPPSLHLAAVRSILAAAEGLGFRV